MTLINKREEGFSSSKASGDDFSSILSDIILFSKLTISLRRTTQKKLRFSNVIDLKSTLNSSMIINRYLRNHKIKSQNILNINSSSKNTTLDDVDFCCFLSNQN